MRRLFADLAHGGDLAEGRCGAAGAERILSGEAGSREQGTLVRVQLCVALAERAVREMRYRAFGCPYTLATCEWLACQLSGRSLAALSGEGLAEAVGTPAHWSKALGTPPERLGRLLVIEDALQAALQAPGAAWAAKSVAVEHAADNR